MNKTKFKGVTFVPARGYYTATVSLLRRPWFIISVPNAHDAATAHDVAHYMLSGFRVNKISTRAGLNFPDKIQEHIEWIEDGAAKGHDFESRVLVRIQALRVILHEHKARRGRYEKKVRPRYEQVLEILEEHNERLKSLEEKLK